MENVLFNFSVPFNHESILRGKKKLGRVIAILSLIYGVLFSSLTAYLITIQENIVVIAIFAVISLIGLVSAVVCFQSGKYNPKHKNRFYKYDFLEDGFIVSQNSNKNIETYKAELACLYRPYKDKQYIAKVFESNDDLIFRVRVGSYNFSPTYKEFILPKDLLTNTEQDNQFIPTLKEIFGKDYVIKNK